MNFSEFHKANPHVYKALRSKALQAKRGGYRVGMKALFELLRWDFHFKTKHQSFKLNNNYTAPYARLLMENEPELYGYFETRAAA